MPSKSLIFILLFLFLFCSHLFSQNIEYLQAFSKTYGIVRYFQPTLESQKTDWESLAIYGAYEVSQVKTKEELVHTLRKVFYPISAHIIIDSFPNTPLKIHQERQLSYYKHTGAGLDASIPRSVPKEYKPYFTEVITKTIDSIDVALTQSIHQELARGVFLHYSVCVPYSNSIDKAFTDFYKRVNKFHKREFKKVATVKKLLKNKSNSYFPHYYQLGYVTILWNAGYYFNPYIDKAMWYHSLEKYLKNMFVVEDMANHFINLQIMTSDMSDAHAKVFPGLLTTTSFLATRLPDYSVELETDLVENKLMVQFSNEKFVKKGDVIKKINGKEVEERIVQKLPYASGANRKAKMNDAAKSIFEVVRPHQFDTLTLDRYKQEDTTVVLTLKKNVFLIKPKKEQDFIRNLENDICYIDVCNRSFSLEKAKAFIIANKDAKGFIFDVRGYPSYSSDELLAFFSPKPLEGLEMITPVITSPVLPPDTTSRVEVAIYKTESVQSKAKLVCLSSSKTYSYPETWLGTVKKNKIGTIIGEATAGTNGDVVMVKNTKIFQLMFTGLIVKMNGQRTHGIGILPDIEVSPSVEGIREGRDEVFEKALEFLRDVK